MPTLNNPYQTMAALDQLGQSYEVREVTIGSAGGSTFMIPRAGVVSHEGDWLVLDEGDGTDPVWVHKKQIAYLKIAEL